jgi:hypothetical protein
MRKLRGEGCKVTVVPAQTKAEDVLALKPDGVFLSNGPGDPEPCTYAVDNIRRLMGRGSRSSEFAWASADRDRSRRENFQAQVWTPRRESSREAVEVGED